MLTVDEKILFKMDDDYETLLNVLQAQGQHHSKEKAKENGRGAKDKVPKLKMATILVNFDRISPLPGSKLTLRILHRSKGPSGRQTKM